MSLGGETWDFHPGLAREMGLKYRPVSQVALIRAKLELPLELSGRGSIFSSGAGETLAGSSQAHHCEKDGDIGKKRE